MGKILFCSLNKQLLGDFLKFKHKKFLHSWSSKEVRSTFINYYKDRGHKYIESSSVIPWNDKSLEFVNAGMNQFKPWLLGKKELPYKNVVNSQKCIRVGGKHNDLEDVGRDTFHHTFFEMLGNWSFNNYFKREACQMAWYLLTKEFRIPEKRLYVTYFGGDDLNGLLPDLEVKDIWQSLGIPSSHILPFGSKENFWEMGKTGPCGACTEIHYNRSISLSNSQQVNAGHEDLIELWNLVFIQHRRLDDGSLDALDGHHVDTGMGLERILATLNSKLSNYDTDLFSPIFDHIRKISSAPPYTGTFNDSEDCLDQSYRILADHSRMITVALADGLLPHDSYVLRKTIRRAILIGWERFGLQSRSNFLSELALCVEESLGEVYPEIPMRMSNIRNILEYEEEKLKENQSQVSSDWADIIEECPALSALPCTSTNLVEGLKPILSDIKQWQILDRKFPMIEAVRLCINYHLQPNLVVDLADTLKLDLNYDEYISEIQAVREQNDNKRNKAYGKRKNIYKNLLDRNIPSTDDSFKYDYEVSENGSYQYQPHKSEICAILKDGEFESKAELNDKVGIVLKSTNFYCNAGGQLSDTGTITSDLGSLKIDLVDNFKGYVIHSGMVNLGTINVGDEVNGVINKPNRIGCSRVHTCHHLLVAACKAVNGMCYQRESHVSNSGFTLEVFSHPSLTIDQIIHAENIVKEWINQESRVDRITLDIRDALKQSPTMLSGEKYPDNVHVLSTDCKLPKNLEINGSVSSVKSCELCCGTHVKNTGHIGGFAISDIKMLSNGITQLYGVIRKDAFNLNKNIDDLHEKLFHWDRTVTNAVKNNLRVRELDRDLRKWRLSIKKSTLPCTHYKQVFDRTDVLLEMMSSMLKTGSTWKELRTELSDILESDVKSPIVHIMKAEFRGNQNDLENVFGPLSEIKYPTAFICKGWGHVRFAISVPKNYGPTTINVESLLEEIKTSIGRDAAVDFRFNDDHSQIGTYIVNGIKRVNIPDTLSTIGLICKNHFKGIK